MRGEVGITEWEYLGQNVFQKRKKVLNSKLKVVTPLPVGGLGMHPLGLLPHQTQRGEGGGREPPSEHTCLLVLTYGQLGNNCFGLSNSCEG